MIDLLNVKPNVVSTDLRSYKFFIYGRPGTGKALPNSTPIPTPFGPIRLENIKPQQEVIGSDGKPTQVEGVFPQGYKDIYNIYLNNGLILQSTLDHLWFGKHIVGEKAENTVVSLEEIRKIIENNKFSIPVQNTAIEYKTVETEVDPYVVGAFSANGIHVDGVLGFLGAEDVAKKLGGVLGYYPVSTEDADIWKFAKQGTTDEWLQVEDVLKQDTRPEVYIVNDISARQAFLQGIFDARGRIDGNIVSIAHESIEFIYTITETARSLGYGITILPTQKRYFDGDEVYQLQLHETAEKLQKLFKIADTNSIKEAENISELFIEKVEYSHREQCTCIKVAAENSLFLTEHFIPTHNTTTASSFPDTLLIATEKGYLTIPDVEAVDVNSWVDMLTVVAQLRRPEIKERYKSVCIDTVDKMASILRNHILTNNNARKESDIPYGGFYSQFDRQFAWVLDEIAGMGYGVILLGHSDTKTYSTAQLGAVTQEDEQFDGQTYLTPSIDKRSKKIIDGFVDLQAVVTREYDETGKPTIYINYEPNAFQATKTRFANITPKTLFSYENFQKAILDAIQATTTNTTDKQRIIGGEVEYTEEQFKNAQKTVMELAEKLIAIGKQQFVAEQMEEILGGRITETAIEDTGKLLSLKQILETA